MNVSEYFKVFDGVAHLPLGGWQLFRRIGLAGRDLRLKLGRFAFGDNTLVEHQV